MYVCFAAGFEGNQAHLQAFKNFMANSSSSSSNNSESGSPRARKSPAQSQPDSPINQGAETGDQRPRSQSLGNHLRAHPGGMYPNRPGWPQNQAPGQRIDVDSDVIQQGYQTRPNSDKPVEPQPNAHWKLKRALQIQVFKLNLA